MRAWVRARLRALGDAGRLGRRTDPEPLTVHLPPAPSRAITPGPALRETGPLPDGPAVPAPARPTFPGSDPG